MDQVKPQERDKDSGETEGKEPRMTAGRRETTHTTRHTTRTLTRRPQTLPRPVPSIALPKFYRLFARRLGYGGDETVLHDVCFEERAPEPLRVGGPRCAVCLGEELRRF